MNNKFVLIGDSLTFGYGVPKKESWVFNLSKYTSLEIINKGINGDTTPSMLDRFYEDVSSYSPKAIFIMGGTNDLLMGHSIDKIVNNIEEMIIESKRITSNIFIGIPPCIIKEMANNLFTPSLLYKYCEESLPIFRRKIIDLCLKENIPYIDFYTITNSNKENNIFIDGIHLNFPGNNLLLKEALNIIKI